MVQNDRQRVARLSRNRRMSCWCTYRHSGRAVRWASHAWACKSFYLTRGRVRQKRRTSQHASRFWRSPVRLAVAPKSTSRPTCCKHNLRPAYPRVSRAWWSWDCMRAGHSGAAGREGAAVGGRPSDGRAALSPRRVPAARAAAPRARPRAPPHAAAVLRHVLLHLLGDHHRQHLEPPRSRRPSLPRVPSVAVRVKRCRHACRMISRTTCSANRRADLRGGRGGRGGGEAGSAPCLRLHPSPCTCCFFKSN